MHTTPVSLLERLRSVADQEAWARFVHLYSPLLYEWAKRAGFQVNDAADLIQDVLLTLMKRLPEFQYDPQKSFRAWLFTLLRTHLLNRRKAAARRPLGDGAVPVDELPGSDPVAFLEEAEYRQYLVNRALQLLQADFQPRTWRAFWAYVVDGRPAADVAKEFGVTEGAVYTAKVRIVDRLRRELAGLMD